MPILSSSFSIYFLISNPFCLIFSSSSQIVSKILLSLAHPSFHCFQFLSSLLQYSLLYCLSNYPNNFFTINHSGSSFLLNVPSFFSYHLMSSMFYWYSFLYPLIASLVFSRFFLSFQVFDSAVNSFHYTKYLFFSCIHCLFRILSTFYSFYSSIITRASCFFSALLLVLHIFVFY